MRSLSVGMRAALGLAMLCTGCLAPLPRPGRRSGEPARDVQQEFAGSYARWRYIAIRRPGLASCPDAGEGWTGRPLFAVTRRKGDGREVQAAIDELARFCVYELTSDDVDKLPAAPRSADLVEVSPDVAGVAAAGSDDLPRMTAPLLHAQFEQQAGMLDGASPHGAPGSPVATRLAFLDTQPDGEGAPTSEGNSAHGYTLAHLAAELTGGAAPGPQIATRLAMPRTKFDAQDPRQSPEDLRRGGYFGLVGDLAQAVQAEVGEWERSSEPSNLVLNLSLGWDPRLTGGCGAPEMTAVKAVHLALRYAALRGVLVIAAAGNRSAGTPGGSGPMLPAAWESECAAAPVSTGSDDPILYAVGAVQADGRPLGNMRPGAMPPRAAFGDHVVVRDLSALAGRLPDGSFLPAMTGTSVSAAIVSATAAAVWELRPALDRRQVMALVTGSGQPLDMHAEFGVGVSRAGSLVARQVTYGAALAAACAGGLCGSWAPQSPSVTGTGAGSLDAAEALFEAKQTLDGARFQTMQMSAPPCSSGTMHYAGQPPANACPDEDSVGIDEQPYMAPQPSTDPCPNCTIGPGNGNDTSMQAPVSVRPASLVAGPGGGGQVGFAKLAAPAGAAGHGRWTLRMKLRTDWPVYLTDAVLNVEVVDPRGSAPRRQRISYALGSAPLNAGASYKLWGIAIPDGARVESAWLSFLQNGLAVRSQLFVVAP